MCRYVRLVRLIGIESSYRLILGALDQREGPVRALPSCRWWSVLAAQGGLVIVQEPGEEGATLLVKHHR